MFNTIEDLSSYQKYLRPLNENCIYYYLNTIYQYLLMREESEGVDINEINSKNLFSNTLKQKANENGISLRNFLQYLDIQEFMCERLFKYLDKTKTGQLTKAEFVNGLDTIFYGNLQELYKLIFFMCDFNENGKIHKFNMKLILSYIPVKTYEEQQKYIKNINSIIDNYFTNLDKRFPEKNIKIDKEINFDLFKNDIEEYIKESNNNKIDNFNNNGAFLLFIKLISYIYINNPFNKENMNFSKFLKNKFLMKLPKKPTKPENNNINTTLTTNTNNINININKEKETKNGTNNAENNDKDQVKLGGNVRSNSLFNAKKKKLNNNVTPNIKSYKELSSSKELPIDNKNDLMRFSMNINELKKAKLLHEDKQFYKYNDWKIKDFLEESDFINKKKEELNKDILNLCKNIKEIKKENKLFREDFYQTEDERRKINSEQEQQIKLYTKKYTNQIRVISMRIKLLKNYFNNLNKTLKYLNLDKKIKIEKKNNNDDDDSYLNEPDKSQLPIDLSRKINNYMDFSIILNKRNSNAEESKISELGKTGNFGQSIISNIWDISGINNN